MLTSHILILRARKATASGIVLMLALALGWASPSWAADAYLDSLEAEASDLKVDSASEPNATPVLDDAIPDDLDQGGFETLLRSRYIGSFMFYNKLNATDKSAVYEEYMSSKDIEVIRKKIISLFSSE